MKHTFPFFLILFIFFYSNCNTVDEEFYSFEESSARLLTAYSLKDMECSSNRNITSLIPGRSRKKDIDNCVTSIAFEKCSFWTQAGDPVPFACKAIEYRK
ncbi:hypothetical protein EHQ53_05670 [Leptospira langatensis]|uniref:Lipoprotein n=1 Tax=Leptospira langatensis TaxID=2484983 RepID=A0A5F1ZV40_9LEPT|nr:hypothetical protein [Leptospira langatensis]TGK02953.1 hypothetical protein EHO57_06505 [Leptospira langatensis]TGL41708.1 hypothetical protein EHQ53_05670 [Leptospira langatensis]